MNRRSFLKRIGQTIAGVVAVPSLLKGKQKAIKPICTCPAPYKADVNNELVRHYDYCIFAMFRPDSELVCIPQNIVRSDEEKMVILGLRAQEAEKIPGAREWIDECEDRINKVLEKQGFPNKYMI